MISRMPWALLALLISVFISGWTANGWRLGNDVKQIKLDLANETIRADRERDARRKIQDERNSAVADSIIIALELERAQGRTITKEVIRYVQSPDAGQCRLPDNWVRLHEVAAGVDPDAYAKATGRADGAARAFTDADAIQVIVSNYQSCREISARLAGWQSWYRETSK